jgi:hypothetical protein
MALGYRWSKRYVSLQTAILSAIQAALKWYGTKHPDSKRTRRVRMVARARRTRKA